LACPGADDVDGCGMLGQIAHGRSVPGNIIDAVRPDGHDRGPLDIGTPDPPGQGAGRSILRQGEIFRHSCAHGVFPPYLWLLMARTEVDLVPPWGSAAVGLLGRASRAVR